MAISSCHQLCALGQVCTVHTNTSKLIYMQEQDNSPTEQFGNTVVETIRQQILIQTLFLPEFTRNDQGLFKSSSHIFFKSSNHH